MSAITIDSDLVHYEVLGRGRPVILLHGWLGSWRYWIPLMRQIQMKNRVYAVDLFGFGDSSKNPARYPIPQQIELLDDLLKQMAISKAALVAHGLGAQVAVEFAHQYPDRVARIMLTGAPLFDPGNLATRLSPSNASLSSQEKRERLHQEAIKRGTDTLRGGGTLPTTSNNKENVDNPLQLALAGGMEQLLSRCFKRSQTTYGRFRDDIAKADNAALTASIKGFDAREMLDGIRELKLPTVIVHGTEDPVIPHPSDDVWDYLMTDNEKHMLLVPLPGVQHFPMIEHEPFQRLLGHFLGTPDVSKIEVKDRWRRRNR